MRFRDHWTKLSQKGKPGRDKIAKEIRDLIRKMSRSLSDFGVRSEISEKYSPFFRSFEANSVTI